MPQTSETNTIPPSSSLPSQVSRDAPPIITYPEFLTTPTQPPPIITAQRLLTTLYLFGGLSALLYGTTNYLVTPMLASLNSSRHTLAETAQANLDKLVAKLEPMVSETPETPSKEPYRDYPESDSDSDPTEMFHRDIGVQTSLPNTPLHSRPTSPSPPTTALEEQKSRLNVLHSHIEDLVSDSTSEEGAMENSSTAIQSLKEYLETLAYVAPTYNYSNTFGSSAAKKDDENDEIANLKAQIRGVKGVLLSARSFPGTASRPR